MSSFQLGLQLIAENEEKNAKLVKQSCADTITLMSKLRRFFKQIIGSTKS